MAIVTLVLAVELIVLGVTGYKVTGSAHHTALIPAYGGLVFGLLAVLSIFLSKARKHLMHLAALLGLIGFLGGAMSFLDIMNWIHGTSPDSAAKVISKAIMSGLCLLYLFMCIESFMAARRARKAQT